MRHVCLVSLVFVSGCSWGYELIGLEGDDSTTGSGAGSQAMVGGAKGDGSGAMEGIGAVEGSGASGAMGGADSTGGMGGTDPVVGTVCGGTSCTSTTGCLKLLLKSGQNPSDTAVDPVFQLVNDGPASVDLDRVSLRYFYTDETANEQVVECFDSDPSCSSLGFDVVRMDPPALGADAYLEVTFTADAGALSPGESTGQINPAVHEENWAGSYDETDDHSWRTDNSFVESPNVALYVDGTLAWGVEPTCL